jgi:hypothetical protein
MPIAGQSARVISTDIWNFSLYFNIFTHSMIFRGTTMDVVQQHMVPENTDLEGYLVIGRCVINLVCYMAGSMQITN